MVNFVLICQTRGDTFLTKSTITPKFSLKHQNKNLTLQILAVCTTITIAASNTWNYLLSGLSIWFKGLRSESFKGGGMGETDGFFPLLILHSLHGVTKTKFLLSVSKHFQAKSDENKKRNFSKGQLQI